MTTFVSPFTGSIIDPTDISYYALNFSSNTPLYWAAVVNPTQVPLARIMDCVASTTGLVIALPQADQGTQGADTLIRNQGANAFTVTAFDGSQAVSVPAGVSKYFYLSDNTTPAGVWNNLTFGTGTSYADAATLAGAGLTTTSAGKLATTGNILKVSSPPTITDASRAATFVWQGGANTINLPLYSTITPGWFINFRNNGSGTLTISPVYPATINGQSSIITNPGDSGIILFDSASNNFFTVGWYAPTNVTFSSASYDVDSISGSSFSLVNNAPIIQTYLALSGTRSTSLTITLPNITQLYGLVNNTGKTGYNLIFQISGSTFNTFPLATGQTATIITDNGVIFIITQSQSASTIYAAQDGSAGSPAFTFNSNLTTGMYLSGSGILGFSANGQSMMLLNGTNTSSLQISTLAQFTAGLISGGTF
jgi:hypothetical protein